MTTLKKFKQTKNVIYLFLVCFLISPGMAISGESPTPEDMVMIPGGAFLMGVDKEVNVDTKKMSAIKQLKYAVSREAFHDEGPAHNVVIDAFYLDQYEVSNKHYGEFLKATSHPAPAYWDVHRRNNPQQPVSGVNWNDANAYAQKVGKRLPTEAEWEYAARGGNKSKGYKYSGGNDLDAVGWYDNNSGRKTHPVAQKQPNELGLYDMSGNVWEWCSDWYDEGYYSGSPQTDPQGPNSGDYRVLRGGFWGNSDPYCRVAYRLVSNPDNVHWYYHFGFRLVLSQDL